jgi:chaperone modulatory protein CbpM
MITLEVLCATGGLQADEVERWIANSWLCAEGKPGRRRFTAIDVARARLIRDLRMDFGLDDEATALVLALLDQLYDARRQMRRLCQAIEAADAPTRQALQVFLAASRRRR